MPQRKGLYFMLMRTTWTPHGKQFSYPQPKKASIQRSALVTKYKKHKAELQVARTKWKRKVQTGTNQTTESLM